MHFPGDSTWSMSIGDGGTFPLFVRDALGISTPQADSVPRLTPPVTRLTGTGLSPIETAGIEHGWDRWWLESTTTGGGREPLGIPVRLRQAYTRWRDPAAPGNADGRDRLRRTFSAHLNELLAELEQELGRTPVFTLDIVQLPVAGQFWRRAARARVLASEELMDSRNVIAPLESVIRDLLR
jgi:hypothetical protein